MIELLILIVVVSILAAVGIGIHAGSTTQRQLDGTVKRIRADLALARQNAMATGSTQTVTFSPNTGTYTLAGVRDLDRPENEYVVNLSVPPYEASILSADFDGDTEVVFDAYGRPDSGGTLVVRVGNDEATLTVDAEIGQISWP